MPREVTLLTAQSSFESLHRLADGRKAVVSVDRDLLLHLLIDHTVLVQAVKNSGLKIVEPKPLRQRPTLE